MPGELVVAVEKIMRDACVCQDSWLQLSLDVVMRQQEHLHFAMEGSANALVAA